jgi:tRNA A37 threonylcarbamoyladenosine synthetase subunit TsaC/SUA5/YrdC
VRKTGSPLVATSANRSGKPPLRAGGRILGELGGEVDLILDAGRLPFRQPSTVVLLRPAQAVILRRGEGYKQLERLLGKIGVSMEHGG